MRDIRPYVVMNMAMSADGKISTRRREPITLGSRNDRHLMDTLRAGADAVIIGSGTVRVDGHPLLVRNAELRRQRAEKGLSPHPTNVVLSRGLDIPFQRGIFKHEHTEKILYTTTEAGEGKRKRFERFAEVVVVPRGRRFLAKVLEDLHRRGIKRLLVEGGGKLNFSFFSDRYVDEMYLTVTPRIIGGNETPSVVDGMGFGKQSHPRLELLTARRVGHEVFLRYRVRGG